MGITLRLLAPSAADVHFTAVYGFSIIETAKDNLKGKIIHFGRITGQAIR